MKRLSIAGVIIAASPPMLALTLFYSLAVHMYLSLGDWPNSIGYGGFSSSLVTHAKVQFWWVMVVVEMSIYGWPPAMILCAIVPRARFCLPYLVVFAITVLLCCGLMQLAPERFIDWWRD